MKKPSLLDRPDLAPAANQFALAARASREHSSFAKESLAKYGEHGSLISGCVREHFPEEVKEKLRALAFAVSFHNSAGEALRPRRVRMKTMYDLARAVCRRDGTGFYGFLV
jgi:hypothetical protein